MVKDCEIFSIYRKLQYMKKLLLVQKFDKMLCAVKSMCNNRSTALLFPDIFETTVSVTITPDKAILEYIKCYGPPPDGCYDEELLEQIRQRLEREKETELNN